MAENIVRLKIDSKEYDQKLKQAADGLTRYVDGCRKVGGTLEVVEKDTLAYVKALGSMETHSRTAAGKLSEMSKTFTDLSMQYKSLTEAEKKSEFGKAMAASLDQLKGRITSFKADLAEVKSSIGDMGSAQGGGLFSADGMKGMLQVFGGNMLTKAAGMVMQLGSELGECVSQGVELAKQGEGIRIAFERLGRADLLQGLREATHGTVSDLELMKQAVKFNDFGLSIDELGTMLAFAQQKAKDTGQSVDYMVDSIVTGLGRKSVMILDNLGISAAEIKERMKENGDMTKAVGAIIKDQMAAAGDYMETAADRATKAQVELNNAMERFGRTIQPVAEATSSLWNDMKIGVLDLIASAINPLIEKMTTLGKLRAMTREIDSHSGGQTATGKYLGTLKHYSGNKQSLYNRQVARLEETIAGIDKQIENNDKAMLLQRKIRDMQRRSNATMGTARADARINELSDKNEKLELAKKAYSQILRDYKQGAASILNPKSPATAAAVDASPIKRGTRTTTSRTSAAEAEKYVPVEGSIDAMTEKVRELDKAWRAAADDDSRKKIKEQIDAAQASLDQMTGKAKKVEKTVVAPDLSQMTSGNISAYLKAQNEAMAGAEFGSGAFAGAHANVADATALTNIMQMTLQNGIDDITPDLTSFWQKLVSGEGIEDADWEGLIEKINAQLEDKAGELKGIKIDLNTGKIQDIKNDGKEVSKQFTNAAGAIQSVGSALQNIEDPAVKVAGIIAQAIATIALSYAQAANSPSVAGSGWGWLAFAAAGAATMMSSIAAIHSATGYAEGGIIKGNTYSGDKVRNIGLNAGELVLNKAQQGVIASMLSDDSGRGGTEKSYVTGEMIVLAANRYLQRTGHGEIVTSR